MTPKPQAKTIDEIYLKVQVSLAPKTNGKKFAKWCEETGFTPLFGGRRAWSSGLSTYLRGADGIAFNDGEPFLYYEEDAIDLEALIKKARANERQAMLDALPEKKTHYQQETERTKREKAYYNKAIDQMESAIKLIGGK